MLFHNFKGAGGTVEVLLAGRKRTHNIFLTRMQEALSEAHFPETVITVTEWFGSLKAGGSAEHLDIQGLAVISERYINHETDEMLVEMVADLVRRLAGQNFVGATLKVLFIDEREKVLIETLVDSFQLDGEAIRMQVKDEGIAWYSFSDDFIRSRFHKSRNDLLAEIEKQGTQPPPPWSARSHQNVSVVKTAWRLILAEADKEFGENLKDLIEHRADKQDVAINVDVRTTVEETALALTWPAFALVLNPALTQSAGGKIGAWNGLSLLTHARTRGVPVILRAPANEELVLQIHERRIGVFPYKIVPKDQLLKLCDAVMDVLMHPVH